MGVKPGASGLFGDTVAGGDLLGLCLVGRPVARMLPQDGSVGEVTRFVLLDGLPHGTASALLLRAAGDLRTAWTPSGVVRRERRKLWKPSKNPRRGCSLKPFVYSGLQPPLRPIPSFSCHDPSGGVVGCPSPGSPYRYPACIEYEHVRTGIPEQMQGIAKVTRHYGELLDGVRRTHMPEHSVWSAMRHRCLTPNSAGWRHYGGRGITICDRWLIGDGFAAFYADMGPRPSIRHTLDRIDSDGNYEPSNCRWATWDVQGANKRARRKSPVKTVDILASSESQTVRCK